MQEIYQKTNFTVKLWDLLSACHFIISDKEIYNFIQRLLFCNQFYRFIIIKTKQNYKIIIYVTFIYI